MMAPRAKIHATYFRSYAQHGRPMAFSDLTAFGFPGNFLGLPRLRAAMYSIELIGERIRIQ